MRLDPKVGGHATLFYIHHMNRVNSCSGDAIMTAAEKLSFLLSLSVYVVKVVFILFILLNCTNILQNMCIKQRNRNGRSYLVLPLCINTTGFCC